MTSQRFLHLCTICFILICINLPAVSQNQTIAFEYYETGGRKSRIITPIDITEDSIPRADTIALNAELIDESDLDIDSLLSETRVFPNPTTGLVMIELSTGIDLSSTVLILDNILGEPVYKYEHPLRQSELNLEDHPAGVYFVTVKVSSGKKTWKIIKH